MAKKSFIAMLLLVFVVGVSQVTSAKVKDSSKDVPHVWERKELGPKVVNSAQVETLYFFNFEEDSLEFQSIDGTDVGIMWHIEDEFLPWASRTQCSPAHWRLSTPHSPDGYGDWWYQVLDTPPIDLPYAKNINLTIMARWAIEPPAEEYAFDGWAVRVSTDGGVSFDGGLEPTEPIDVFRDSCWAFQFHGEHVSEGVAGFAGSNDEWTNLEFSLADYAGQNVVVRLAFVSDGCASTHAYPSSCGDDPHPDWYGVLIDDFTVEVYTIVLFLDDADEFINLVPAPIIRGNCWELTTSDSHSDSHSWWIDVDDSLEFNTNWLETPWLKIPVEGYIEASFWMKNDMPDSDGDGDDDLGDYFEVSVTPDEKSWIRLFHDYDRNGDDETWMLWVDDSLSNGTLRLNDWRGDSLKLRWLVTSDGNHDGGNGTGMWIDDVLITKTLGCIGLRGDPKDDGNGSIDLLDVLTVANHILEIVTMRGDAFCRGDCNGDGDINILDALGIANVILGTGECAPGACKTDLTSEAMEVLESLQSFLSAEDYARFMSLVKRDVGVPAEYSLAQNYPNPFNPETAIEYTLPEAAKVRLEVYNLIGQLIEVLVDSEQEPGSHWINWEASDVTSGIYFYRLTADHFTDTRRMVLIR